jgi:hypothetical protein
MAKLFNKCAGADNFEGWDYDSKTRGCENTKCLTYHNETSGVSLTSKN